MVFMVAGVPMLEPCVIYLPEKHGGVLAGTTAVAVRHAKQ